MNPRRSFAIFSLSVVVVAALGYAGWRSLSTPTPPPWPQSVAVLGVDPDDPRRPVTYMAVMAVSTQTVVEVPPDAVVEIPGSGFLRAFHAYRLGGAALTQSTLGRLFGIRVPYSAYGRGTTLESVVASVQEAQVAQVYVDELREALAEAPSWRRVTVEGERKSCDGEGDCLILDPASVQAAARLIGGLGTRVFVDPTREGTLLASPPAAAEPPPATPEPPAPLNPADITVEVLNGGRVEMAATRTAQRLREAGYQVSRIGDHRPQDRPDSHVYFAPGNQDAARQVGEFLGYPVQALPEGLSTSAAVLVVLGHDASV